MKYRTWTYEYKSKQTSKQTKLRNSYSKSENKQTNKQILKTIEHKRPHNLVIRQRTIKLN